MPHWRGATRAAAGWKTTRSRSRPSSEFLKKLAGERSLAADVWDGVQAVEVADAVYQSTRSGQAVRLQGR
jgi:predicted dehydrogenase